MEAYSIDLRERVLRAYDEGRGDSRKLAEIFGVSSAWIRKLIKQRRQTGSIAPLPRRYGPKPRLSEQQLERLAKLVHENPDATLAELGRRLRVNCSVVTIHRGLKKLGLRYKKSHSAPPNRIART